MRTHTILLYENRLIRGETQPKGAGKRRAVAQKDYVVHSTITSCQKDCAGNAPCIADEAQVPQVSGQYSAEYLRLCHTVCQLAPISSSRVFTVQETASLLDSPKSKHP